MKKSVITIFITIVMTIMLSHSQAHAEVDTSKPKELLYHDIFISMLLPNIQKQTHKYYSTILTKSPVVYPYMVYVENAERNHFRGFSFSVTLKVIPVVGPHISVGIDKFTFKIDSSKVELENFNHIKTCELPPNWQHIVK
ncbi:DUF3888 domain-containing protein [Halobacillus naozhouensis]|uniref:DUF3888 domain-containing protein n=1 Tax=Halobacillus naozhouensis TaxID=554880 RepID=A0ABY8IY96_9BACI|nr:DUF3888 domain-containing protein [Halobacillus naozhouensis]WFT74154.1 DUF3888 domain-containing protein [Halobacillus naozhouensis]